MGMTFTVVEWKDGVKVETVHEMGAELERIWKEGLEEEERLLAAGTPYYCHCEPEVDMFAAMDDGSAYWKPNEYGPGQGDGIHRKHGVMHRPCGGYLQEG